jgi:hypothetical protein
MKDGQTDRDALERLISFARREALDQAHEFTAYLLKLAEESIKPHGDLALQNADIAGFILPRQQRLN